MERVRGYYGSQHIPCCVYVEGNAYVVEGSQNVNFTHNDLQDGVDVEIVEDYDCFNWNKPIDSEEEFLKALED